MKEVNDLLNRLGELEDAPLIWINKKVYDMAQEIKILKEEYVMLQNASDKVEEEKNKEIERLNNIINGMEKYLWEERYNHHGEYVISGRKAEDIYTLILDKLQELKGSDKEC